MEIEYVVLVVLTLTGQINSTTTLDPWHVPANLWRQAFYGVMVERRDSPSRLRGDDDDDECKKEGAQLPQRNSASATVLHMATWAGQLTFG